MKTCSKCGMEKPPTAFHKQSEKKDGLRPDCKECVLVRQAKAYAADPAPKIDRVKRYYRQNAAKVIKRSAEWYRANREYAMARQAAWMKAHPELVKEYSRKAEAKERGATVADLTASQWAEIKERYNLSCAYCGEKVPVLTQDHVLALKKGGQHTASNVVPACQPCNRSKSDKPLADFLKTLETPRG